MAKTLKLLILSYSFIAATSSIAWAGYQCSSSSLGSLEILEHHSFGCRVLLTLLDGSEYETARTSQNTYSCSSYFSSNGELSYRARIEFKPAPESAPRLWIKVTPRDGMAEFRMMENQSSPYDYEAKDLKCQILPDLE